MSPRLAAGRRKILGLWLVAIIIVTTGSLLPPSGLHRIHYDDLNLNDKLVHFLNYSALAFLPMLAMQFPKRGLLLAGGMIPFGGVLELIQRLVPGRTCELGDFLANSLGVLAGVLLAVVWKAAVTRQAPDPYV